MNPNLARLHALQCQAGARRSTSAMRLSAVKRARPMAPDVRALRQQLRLREPRCAAPAASAADRALPGAEIAPGLRLVKARLPALAVPSRIAGAFDRREDFAAARVLFFDTETTGLAGGTGTRAFMLGAAAWHGDFLHIRQLLMTCLAAERAMLAEFARWLGPDTILVSYNGKSYDAPLLRTRYRLARMRDPMTGLEHVDLLHAARRRYRGVFADCRLATIEREVLRIVRDDDLPGSEAPAAWRDYLHGRSSRNLCRVLAHNHQDVATLARLLLQLSIGPTADRVASRGAPRPLQEGRKARPRSDDLASPRDRAGLRAFL